MARNLKYFGQNRMAAWQDPSTTLQNASLVKYKPTWGLGPKGMIGSKPEGWTPNIGDMMRDAATVKVRHNVFPMDVNRPASVEKGLYWTGSGVAQLDPRTMANAGGMQPTRSVKQIMGDPDAEKKAAKEEKAGQDLMKGFRMLHAGSPELQEKIPIKPHEWADMSPNMIKGIVSGLDIMGDVEKLGAPTREAARRKEEGEAIKTAFGTEGSAMDMMKAYTESGGRDVSGTASTLKGLREPKKFEVKTGELEGRRWRSASANSVVWDKEKETVVAKMPFTKPTFVDDEGVTWTWNDKDKEYEAHVKNDDDITAILNDPRLKAILDDDSFADNADNNEDPGGLYR